MSFAKRLKEKRWAAGLSKQQVGERIGVSEYTISGWENEKHPKHPSFENLAKLCTLFGCTSDELIGIKHDERTDLSYALKSLNVAVDGVLLSENEKMMLLDMARSLVKNRGE